MSIAACALRVRNRLLGVHVWEAYSASAFRRFCVSAAARRRRCMSCASAPGTVRTTGKRVVVFLRAGNKGSEVFSRSTAGG